MDKLEIDTIIISGGGCKGISYVGALIALYEKNKNDINNIKILAGSSIGGIITFALCAGYTLYEIKKWFLEIEFSRLCPVLYDTSCSNKILPFISTSYSLGNDDEIKKILIKIFTDKNFNYNDLTFEDLYNKTNKLLVLTGSNLTLQKCDYFSYRKTPDMKIYDALLITTRIPFIFPYIKYNNCFYVDGHLFDPFPIKGCGKINKNNVLGIISINYRNKPLIINDIKDFTLSMLEGVSKEFIKKIINKYKKNIIFIDIDKKFFDMNISLDEMNSFYNIGFNSGLDFLK